MRLALVTFYPLDTRYIEGGIRMVAYNLAQALRVYEELDIRVIHCHNQVTEDQTIREGNLTVCHRTLRSRRGVPNLTKAVARVRQELEIFQPDLVHAHAGHFAYAGVRSGVPTVYTVHGALPRERQIYSATLYDRLRYSLLAFYESRALAKTARLVAISPYIRGAYSRLPETLWERIDNPVPQAFFDLEDRAEAGRLLYAGSITEIKDLITLLKAVERVRSQVPKVALTVAGRSTSLAYERQVKAFVAERHLADVVRFVGLLDRQQMLEAYSQSAVVVLPSIQENAPMTIIEAMASGKPVVATRVGGIPDLVEEGVTGFMVSAGDSLAMAERIVRLLGDDLRRSMGIKAREAARARFSAEKVGAAYVALYHRVLTESGARPEGR